jgi:hypothetical protein
MYGFAGLGRFLVFNSRVLGNSDAAWESRPRASIMPAYCRNKFFQCDLLLLPGWMVRRRPYVRISETEISCLTALLRMTFEP